MEGGQQIPNFMGVLYGSPLAKMEQKYIPPLPPLPLLSPSRSPPTFRKTFPKTTRMR